MYPVSLRLFSSLITKVIEDIATITIAAALRSLWSHDLHQNHR